MARAKVRVQASELQGLKYFEMVSELIERLRPVGTERDKAGNRELFLAISISRYCCVAGRDEDDVQRTRRHLQDPDRSEDRIGVHVVVGSLHRRGTACDAAPRKLADLHFGLCVERDAECFRFAGRFGVDISQVLEDGVALGNLFSTTRLNDRNWSLRKFGLGLGVSLLE